MLSRFWVEGKHFRSARPNESLESRLRVSKGCVAKRTEVVEPSVLGRNALGCSKLAKRQFRFAELRICVRAGNADVRGALGRQLLPEGFAQFYDRQSVRAPLGKHL